MTMFRLTLQTEGAERQYIGFTVALVGFWFGVTVERKTLNLELHLAHEWDGFRYWRSRGYL